ncbi:hypothetical protein, partial [Paucibacter sp. XJ19-41]|uniref:hypothetical protein n=1 Tax=Paucibacter sp. XJ19-41 TaxID=2927824 RepID=UPI003FA70634
MALDVLEQLHQHLAQGLGVGVQLQCRVQLQAQPGAGAQRPLPGRAHQGVQAQAARQIGGLAGRLVGLHQGQGLFDIAPRQLGALLAAVQIAEETAARHGPAGHAAAQRAAQVGGRAQRGQRGSQRGVELMGHAGQQLAQAGQLAGLQQLGLQLALQRQRLLQRAVLGLQFQRMGLAMGLLAARMGQLGALQLGGGVLAAGLADLLQLQRVGLFQRRAGRLGPAVLQQPGHGLADAPRHLAPHRPLPALRYHLLHQLDRARELAAPGRQQGLGRQQL